MFYDVWLIFERSRDDETLLSGMNRFPDFFHLDAHANFLALVVTTAALFKQDNDTINVPSLVKASEKLIKRTVYDEVARDVTELKCATEKVLILRNNLFGHRDHSMPYQDAFRAAGLAPRKVRAALELALKITNALLRERRLPERHDYECSPEEVKELLKAIVPS